MRKPSPSTRIVETYPDSSSGRSKSLQNDMGCAERSPQRHKLHSRFNPSVVGFGILETAQPVVHDETRTDEAIKTIGRSRFENLKEGK